MKKITQILMNMKKRGTMDSNINLFEKALLSLDRINSKKYFNDLIKNDSIELIDEVIIPILERIGNGWENGSIALSQVYMIGLICEELVDEILPAESPLRERQPKTAIAVLEDYHMLGKRIVYSALRASGFEVLDYGRMQADKLAEKIIEDNVEILLISTLMLSSALKVGTVRQDLNSAGKNNVKIVVGGAPFRIDSELWKEVGADAMGSSAADAKRIISGFAGGAK